MSRRGHRDTSIRVGHRLVLQHEVCDLSVRSTGEAMAMVRDVATARRVENCMLCVKKTAKKSVDLVWVGLICTGDGMRKGEEE